MQSPGRLLPLPARSGIWKRRLRREAALAYLLLLPSALILGTFGFLPLANALLLSLRDWRLIPGGFVGLLNYQRLLTADPIFQQSLVVTMYYVLGTVPATLALGYLLAELLHSKIRGLGFYRTLYFVPYIVSPVAAAAVWRWILDPDFGVATALISRLGVHARWLHEEAGIFRLMGEGLRLPVPEWAGGPSLALVCIIGVTIWHNLGFAAVVLLAGLSAVPTDVIEAARLDGARGWSLMRRVKLPLLSPTLFFLLVVFTIRAFQTFTQIFVMSIDHEGGPAGTTRNITLYIYQSFNVYKPRLGPGYGAAMAMLLFAIILVLTLVQFRVVGRRVHYG
jgi:multiple sugar transport system permease protein